MIPTDRLHMLRGIFLSLLTSLILTGCIIRTHPPEFPDRELEHRQTRGYDPKPSSIDGGKSKVTVFCNNGTRFNVPSYDRSVCDDHSGIDYHFSRD